MKRILLAVAIVLVAAAALAADAVDRDRDVRITTDGTVFSIAARASDDGSSSSLVLTVVAGGKTTQSTLPESTSGTNGFPNLAYDAASKTVFVVWVRTENAKSTSDLLVANYDSSVDRWNAATVIDSGPVQRSNVTIRFTRQVSMLRGDGTYGPTSALILHAAWWQKSPWGENPYYAVMPLSGGFSYDADIHDLTEFAPSHSDPRPVTSDFMRHVALVDGPTSDSVYAIFSDSRNGSFYRMTLRPIAETRVHIPVGVRGPGLGGPKATSFDWSGRTGTIASGDGNTIIFTNTTDKKVAWVTWRNGDWLAEQEVALSDNFTASTALAALAKMAVSSE